MAPVPILVYGDLMLDQYIDGIVKRISPEAPVPVVHVQKTTNVIGGCGNVSAGIAALATPQVLVGFVAKDANGKTLTKLLNEKNIKHSLLSNGLPTTTKVRVVSNKHQLLRYDIETIATLTKPQIEKTIQVLSKLKFTYAVLSDYGKGACTPLICAAIINAAPTLVDPKSSDWKKYSGAYLISPNFKEFCEAIGSPIEHNEAQIEQHARALMQQYNIANMLVTRSEKGMSLITNKKALHIATQAKEVYDVTGAGDTVIATIAACLHKGKKLEEAVKLANKAAAIAVGHFGTYAVTKKDLGI